MNYGVYSIGFSSVLSFWQVVCYAQLKNRLSKF